MKNWLSVIAESPLTFFFGLIIIALVVYFYFDSIKPAIEQIVNK